MPMLTWRNPHLTIQENRKMGHWDAIIDIGDQVKYSMAIV